MKTAVVTGANGGLGFEFVKCLTELGWAIKATVRNPKKECDLTIYAKDNPQVQVHALDLSSSESIDLFQKDLGKSIDKLDLLINNAGLNSKSNSDYSMASSVRVGELKI